MRDVPANMEMLASITADAREYGGPWLPSVWPLEIETYSLDDMLDGLIGPIGLRPADSKALAWFSPFLQQHSGFEPEGWSVQIAADYGTAMDMGLLVSLLPSSSPLRICEVGGGYGRLAEAFIRLRPVHYVLVDAVPAVLMYAYEYLRREFPGKVGSYYAGDEYDDGWLCYIVPAWHTKVLYGTFDLTVNIESMQEMNKTQVGYFLRLFDRLMVEGGISYISNARDYKYIGPWHFPSTWETLWQHNTPRSWTRDHPTIIMRKGRGQYMAQRDVCERDFQEEMQEWTESWASMG